MARAVTSFIKLTLPPTTVCVCVCVRACVRACVRVRVRVGGDEWGCECARVRVCMGGGACVCVYVCVVFTFIAYSY